MANLNGIQERLKKYKETEGITYAELGKLIGVNLEIPLGCIRKFTIDIGQETVVQS